MEPVSDLKSLATNGTSRIAVVATHSPEMSSDAPVADTLEVTNNWTNGMLDHHVNVSS